MRSEEKTTDVAFARREPAALLSRKKKKANRGKVARGRGNGWTASKLKLIVDFIVPRLSPSNKRYKFDRRRRKVKNNRGCRKENRSSQRGATHNFRANALGSAHRVRMSLFSSLRSDATLAYQIVAEITVNCAEEEKKKIAAKPSLSTRIAEI